MELIKLTEFLDRLDEADIHYTLSSLRESAVLVSAVVDDERWEIEFMADGDVEVEIFTSDGEIHDETILTDLFERDDED
ncbi:MAG: hypothetical protein ACU84Q_10905 [Gammaproteobacteria bacterium]